MKLGIIGAMEMEVELIKEHMRDVRVTRRAGMDFFEGALSDVPVVVVRSGVGKVNAAMCAQILVDVFEVTHVVNTGAAGSLDARIDIGDMVVADELLYYDVDATVFGYALGEVPQLGTVTFEADEVLCLLARTACAEAAPEVGVHGGRIVSGDCFVTTREMKDKLIENFSAQCCEMEGAAIAQACWLNNIPFVVVRSISDKADGTDEIPYDEFERAAAERSARVVVRMVELMGE